MPRPCSLPSPGRGRALSCLGPPPPTPLPPGPNSTWLRDVISNFPMNEGRASLAHIRKVGKACFRWPPESGRATGTATAWDFLPSIPRAFPEAVPERRTQPPPPLLQSHYPKFSPESPLLPPPNPVLRARSPGPARRESTQQVWVGPETLHC